MTLAQIMKAVTLTDFNYPAFALIGRIDWIHRKHPDRVRSLHHVDLFVAASKAVGSIEEFRELISTTFGSIDPDPRKREDGSFVGRVNFEEVVGRRTVIDIVTDEVLKAELGPGWPFSRKVDLVRTINVRYYSAVAAANNAYAAAHRITQPSEPVSQGATG